jgi:hypothetical protein
MFHHAGRHDIAHDVELVLRANRAAILILLLDRQPAGTECDRKARGDLRHQYRQRAAVPQARRWIGQLIEELRVANRLAKGARINGGPGRGKRGLPENPRFDEPSLLDQGVDKNLAKAARAAATRPRAGALWAMATRLRP